ncbi:M23 family metallopeptidase [Pedobacter hartonius]|nr:M23 family metallopeptidase [Pedobacter hartonius]
MVKLYLTVFSILLFSCKSGTVNLFKPTSPHEQYQHKLVSAGLDKTAIGSAWIVSSLSILQKALTVELPYRETGYFAAETVPAAAYRLSVVQGQKISVRISKKPENQFMIYTDVWEQSKDGQMKHLVSADTVGNALMFDVKTGGMIFIRLQPELLRSGQYTLEITAGPSLAFPVKSSNSSHIKSLFGDGRDANSRKHEGIDIFAPYHTPVVASAEGTVVRVNDNKLGGKVVWLRPKDRDYILYYAHLDQQLAAEGQVVVTGDTLGLVGNTGNAKTTLPHLHFGIYTSGGTVDPFPFVNTTVKTAAKVSASLINLNATLRTSGASFIYASPESNARKIISLKSGTIVKVNAASSNWYKVELPDGKPGFIPGKVLASIIKPLRKLKFSSAKELYDHPDSLSGCLKSNLKPGSTVELLGDFQTYQLVRYASNEIGWVKVE